MPLVLEGACVLSQKIIESFSCSLMFFFTDIIQIGSCILFYRYKVARQIETSFEEIMWDF